MNIKRSTKRTSYQSGTQHAPCESDKPCDGTISIFGTVSNSGKRVIPPESYHCEPQKLDELKYSVYSSCASPRSLYFDVILLVSLQFWLSHQFLDEFSVYVVNQVLSISLNWRVNWALRKYQVLRRQSDNSVKVRIQGQFTVKSLHAGTLVTYWTTAPSIPFLRSPKAQLASLLLLLCTLAIATRCYASTNSTYPHIDQAQSTPTFSPIHNSKLHSSNLVLSRLILPHFVQKRYASLASILRSSRTKRELNKTKSNLIPEDPSLRTKGIISRFEEVNVQNLASGKNYHNPGLSYGVGREVASEIQIGENLSDVVSVTGNFSRVNSQKLNYSFPEVEKPDKQLFQEQDRRLMPPVNGHDNYSSVDKWGVVVSIIISSVALTLTFGLITCILSHYRAGAAAEGGGTAADPNNAALTPTSAPMLSVVSAGATAGVGGMERLRGGRTAARDLAAAREQQVRLHALRTDLAVNLPPSITMPDGEDHPYSNSRIHIRDAEQEAEIYQKCIRPPPNRTVLESESPPPYRSSSAGLLGSSSSSSSSGDWSTLGGMSNAPLVERCHSMSSTTRRPEAGGSNQKTDLLQRTVKIFTGKKTTPQAPSPAPTLPVVVVPTRRRPAEQNPPPTTHRPSKGGV